MATGDHRSPGRAGRADRDRLIDRRRLVVVSNRVPVPGAGGAGAGGLVTALLPALVSSGGLWFGWSGRIGSSQAAQHRAHYQGVDFVTVDLAPYELDRYYTGFSNRTLWPVLHGLTQRARFEGEVDYLVWRAVNRRFARMLAPLLRPDDLVFVQDYHLIPFGEALRSTGWGGLLAYFHHVPIPTEPIWGELPHADELADDFVHYDLVSVQTERDRGHLDAILGDRPHGLIEAHPIGIDAAQVRAMADAHPRDTFAALRDGRSILFGVDRLDYTKGIPLRFAAIERLLERRPELIRQVRFVQWAAPSRDAIEEYREERAAVETLAARIALRHPHDEPAILSIADRPRDVVAAALRDADVCLVTSLADGMNLVAKEFVAAQRAEDPGVLILSSSCGAADELTGALIVPSAGVESIERAIEQALAMPLSERQRRWRSMSRAVEANTAQDWLRGVLRALVAVGEGAPASAGTQMRGA